MERFDTNFLEPIKGNYDVDSYIEDLQQDNCDIDAWQGLGYHYQLAGKEMLALRCYEIVLQLDPEKSVTYNNLGSLYEGRKDYAQAVNHYRKAIELYPEYALALRNLGRLYGRLNDAEQALFYLEASVKSEPESMYAWRSLGFYSLKFGLPERAFEATVKAVELGDLDISYLNKGHTHLIAGEEKLALLDYAHSKRAFKDDDHFWKDYNSDYADVIGRYGISSEYYDALKDRITEAEKILPEFGLPEIAGKWAHCRTKHNQKLTVQEALHLQTLGYPESFVNWLKISNAGYYSYDLVRLDEDYLGFVLKSYFGISNCLRDEEYNLLFHNGFLPFAENYESSISAFDRSGKVWQIHSDTYRDLADSKVLTEKDFDGENFGSFEEFLYHHIELTRAPNGAFVNELDGDWKLIMRRDAVKRLPENAAGWTLLGRELQENGKPQLALDCFLISVSFKPDYGPSNYEIGKICFETGKYELAVKHLKKATEFVSPKPIYHVALGDVFAKLDNLREAERCYKEAKRLEAEENED